MAEKERFQVFWEEQSARSFPWYELKMKWLAKQVRLLLKNFAAKSTLTPQNLLLKKLKNEKKIIIDSSGSALKDEEEEK